MSKKNLALSKYCRGIAVAFLLASLAVHSAVAQQIDLKEAARAIRVKDYKLAVELYLAAAMLGDSEAKYQMANLYKQGLGVEKDEQIALQMLEEAADGGHSAAQYNLGLLLFEQDQTAALTLLNASDAQGYRPAAMYLRKLAAIEEQPFIDSEALLARWFSAARRDDLKSMQAFLEQVGDIDRADATGRTALNIAIEFDSKEVAKWLIENGSVTTHVDEFGNNPFFIAALKNNLELLELLLESSENSLQILPNGDTLLHYAARLDRLKLMPMLLKHGIPLNQKNNDEWTVLDLAALSGESDIIDFLEARNARHSDRWLALNQDDKFKRQVTNFGSLELVTVEDAGKIAIGGNIELLKTMLQSQPDLVNAVFDDGSTLLSLAINNGMSDVVAELLSQMADPNQAIYGGITPMHLAARRGDEKIIRQLLAAGADPLAKNVDSWDAVDWSVTEKQTETSIMLVRWLLEPERETAGDVPVDHYILISAQHNLLRLANEMLNRRVTEELDKSGRNAVWHAANNGNEILVDQLLRAGLSANTEDNQGRPPFLAAVSANCLTCAKLLLPYSDINHQTASGMSALMMASMTSDVMVPWLVENSADIELRNAQGNTALMIATENDQVVTAKLLLQAGANVSRKNLLGASALDIAERKNPELYALMKKKTVLGLF